MRGPMRRDGLGPHHCEKRLTELDPVQPPLGSQSPTISLVSDTHVGGNAGKRWSGGKLPVLDL